MMRSHFIRGFLAAARTMNFFHGDSSCRSRPVSAESWNGLGSIAVSSRMRTAAS